MMPIRPMIGRVATAVFGLLLMAYGFYAAHVESLAKTRSVPLILVYLALGLLGALLLPFIGSKVADAAKSGIALGSLGRRAYDGKGEEPKP